jgi:hypothetical protein
MRIGLVLAAALFGLWLVLSATADEAWLAPIGALVALGIIGFGIVVLFGGRCPNCQARLTPRPGLRVPERCATCGAAFPLDD